MEYKASFDKATKVITFLLFLVFFTVGLIGLGIIHFPNTSTATGTGLLIGFVVFLLLLTGCYLFSIKDYVVNDNDLIIRRPIGNRIIPLPDIEEARLIAKGEMKGTIRTFGNGGLFGYYGKFYNRTLGSMTWYVTQRKNMIYIKTTSGNKIIISPDDISIINKVIAR